MTTFYSFPSISQFKENVRSTIESTQFIGFDGADGKPQYDQTIPLPIEEYTGSVKVHGTNAGISYDPKNGELYAQSRNHVLSDKRDNCSFNVFVMNNKDFFVRVLSQISSHSGNVNNNPIVAYGEWFGAGIQKNVAVEKLQKRLMIFAVKIITAAKETTQWLDKDAIELFYSPENFIWNIYNFPTYKITIDYNNPKTSQNQLVEITDQVEKECPVGKYFGVSGIGEGVVWYNKTYGRFKVKGQEHSSSKVKTLAAVDDEKLASIDEFVDYAVTTNRLEQAVEQVFTIYNEKPDVKHTKKFITWITSDIFKEETSTLVENNLIPEDVGKAVSIKARNWFMILMKKTQ